MKAKVINSRSTGNCLILYNDKEAIVLDAGVKYSEIVKTINYNPNIAITCLVTHSHLDHSRYVDEYINRGVTVYLNPEMYDNIKYRKPNVKKYEHSLLYSTKTFDFMPIKVEHDVLNFGFVCIHEDIGEFCYFTDTHYIPINLTSCETMFVEANYCPDIIEKRRLDGSINEAQYSRVRNSHMNIIDTINFLKRCNSKNSIKNVILMHLSDGNSDAEKFKVMVSEQIGITPIIADKNIEINIKL